MVMTIMRWQGPVPFKVLIDCYLRHDSPLVVWSPEIWHIGEKSSGDGIPFTIVRDATPNEVEAAIAAQVADGIYRAIGIPAPYKYIIRLDTLLGQLEAETAQDEPATRPVEQPAEVEQPALTRAQRQLAVLDYLRTDGLAARQRDPHRDGGQFARDIEAFLAEISGDEEGE